MDALADTVIVGLVFATLGIAWSWIGSEGGVPSLGHGVPFACGAYAVAVSNLRGGSPWYGALGGALAALVLAVVVGAVSLRGRGVTFAVATVAAAVLVERWVGAHDWLGPRNVYRFPVHVGFFQLQFSAKWPYAALALAVFAVTVGIGVALRTSRTGHLLRALRADVAGARSVGVRELPPRLTALAASAFVTSVAGSLYAQYALAVAPAADAALGLSLDIALLGSFVGLTSAWAAPVIGLTYALAAHARAFPAPAERGTLALSLEIVAIVGLCVLRSRLPARTAAR